MSCSLFLVPSSLLFAGDAGPEATSPSGPFKAEARLERERAGRGGRSAIVTTIAIPPGTHLTADAREPLPRLEVAAPPPGLVFGALEAPPPAVMDLDLTPTEPDPAKKTFEKGVPAYFNAVTLKLPFTVAADAAPGPRRIEATLYYAGCQERPQYQCFVPGTARLALDFTVTEAVEDAGAPRTGGGAAAMPEPAAFMARGPVAELAAALAAGRSATVLWGLFLAGLASFLLPCVYPLVPITLSVIGARQATSRRQAAALAGAYGLGLMAVYVLLGLLAGLAGGQFNQLIDHAWVVVAIALLCAALAFGMFGAFELGLPSTWQTRLARLGGEGCAGAAVMGVVSGLLASACVGPALIFILVLIAQTGSPLQGALYLFVYSLGLALPYVVIGATAASLPKPGAWMQTVKNAGGLILLGVAIYYLSKVLPDYATLLLAATTAVSVGVYAGAFDPLSGASGAWPRALKSFGIIAVALGILALVGAAQHLGFFFGQPEAGARAMPQVSWRHDGDAALRAAGREGRPVILDFVSDTCTLCREIEKNTLSDARVIESSRHFMMVKVDTTGGRAADLVARYNVRGLPTIVFLDSRGRERQDLAVQGGFLTAEELLRKMRDLLAAN